MSSAASRKYPGIRAPLHPLQLRCGSSPYSPGTSSLPRLAGAAHRRSRCVRLFARRYTPDPRGRAGAPALSFLLLLLLLFAAVPSEAADTVSVDVGAVYASNEGTSIDPALGTIRGKLYSMFNYTSYRMLERKRRSLSVGETGEFELPDRRTMRATPLPARGDKVRLLIQISDGQRKLLTTTLGLRRGGMVLVGGPSHKAGVLILIISAE
ncbi:MAG: hypothetical protein WAV26_02685 [Candidatus Deferrimicrobium sp.]